MARSVGIVFSNIHDKEVNELTEKRTLASVPFGGRYRLIDFVLSNMVNSAAGVNELAELPSKEALIAKVLGSLQSSLYGLAYVLQAYVDKQSRISSASGASAD